VRRSCPAQSFALPFRSLCVPLLTDLHLFSHDILERGGQDSRRFWRHAEGATLPMSRFSQSKTKPPCPSNIMRRACGFADLIIPSEWISKKGRYRKDLGEGDRLHQTSKLSILLPLQPSSLSLSFSLSPTFRLSSTLFLISFSQVSFLQVQQHCFHNSLSLLNLTLGNNKQPTSNPPLQLQISLSLFQSAHHQINSINSRVIQILQDGRTHRCRHLSSSRFQSDVC